MRNAAVPAGVLLLAAALLAGGCHGLRMPFTSGKTSIQVQSTGAEPVRLASKFQTAVYSAEEDRSPRIILSDRTDAELVTGRFEEGLVVHLELLWLPKPGATPMERTATNASIRFIVFTRGEVGVYGGAGFILPRDEPGSEGFELDIRNATLSLLDSTDGFADLLTPAELTGTVNAKLDAARTRRLYFHVSQRVTNELGKSVFVQDSVDVGDAYCLISPIRTRR